MACKAAVYLVWQAFTKESGDADQSFDEGTNPVPEHRDRALLNAPKQDTRAERLRAAIDRANHVFIRTKVAKYLPVLLGNKHCRDFS